MFFKKKESQKVNTIENDCITIWTNDFVNIIHDATKLCWNKPLEKTYGGKLQYIEKRVKIGHNSILEHSNIVMLLKVNKDSYEKFMFITQFMKYLNFSMVERDGSYDVLLSGSIRGYKSLIFEYIEYYGLYDYVLPGIENQNPFINMIKEELYMYCPRELFVDLIEKKYMDDKFYVVPISPHIHSIPSELKKYGVETEYDDKTGTEVISSYDNLDYRNKLECSNSHCVITNIDNILYITNTLANHGAEFSPDEVYKACSVTIFFENISVATATQIGRHRNAETWESKRYVDYTNKPFINPCDYKDKYDKDKKYKLNLKDDISIECTMGELGDMMINLYSQLLTHGFDKEDARSILPSNVGTSLYMTFNYWTLNKFLELRTDKAAQAEVRTYALSIQEAFMKYLDDSRLNSLHPEDPYSEIDEILEDY